MLIWTGFVLAPPNAIGLVPHPVNVMLYLGLQPAGSVNNVVLLEAPAKQPPTAIAPVTVMQFPAGDVLPPTLLIPFDNVGVSQPVGVTNGGRPVKLL